MTIKKLKNSNISGFKLVVASIGTGNVAQLSADLFIESLKMEKFAILKNAAVIPIIGPSAFEAQSGDFTTASEIFISEKDKLLILQTRTPITAKLLGSYIKEVVEFVKNGKLSELMILTSSYSHEQHFIEKSPFEFIANTEIKALGEEFSGFTEAAADFAAPGSGYARKLFQHATEQNIPAVIFYKFVSEGDNFYDSVQLCENLNRNLKVIKEVEGKTEIKIPISWKFLFGRNVNTEIY